MIWTDRAAAKMPTSQPLRALRLAVCQVNAA
jgi:hypothetical protein